MPVPPFKSYYPSVAGMDQEQRAFYDAWLRGWREGRPLQVDGNISYLFVYAYSLLKSPSVKIADVLLLMRDYYGDEPEPWPYYCSLWASDIYTQHNMLQKAVDCHPRLRLTEKNCAHTDWLLSLKLHAGRHLAGRDLFGICGPFVGQWGKDNIALVADHLDAIVLQWEQANGVDLLEYWRATCDSHGHQTLIGSPSGPSTVSENGLWLEISADNISELLEQGDDAPEVPLECYQFSLNPLVAEFGKRAIREAENAARAQHGLPPRKPYQKQVLHELPPERRIYGARKGGRAYYYASDPAVTSLPHRKRQYFETEEEARAAGLKPSVRLRRNRRPNAGEDIRK